MFQIIYKNLRIILPSPELNNTLGVRLGTKVKFAMDGTIWAYRQAPFPYRMTCNFAFLLPEKRIELEDFAKKTMGQILTIIDHNKKVWSAKIVTSPLTTIGQGRGNNTVTVEFEGSLQNN